MRAAIFHVGRADEELDRIARADGVDIQHFAKQIAQRIDVERVSLVRRKQALSRLERRKIDVLVAKRQFAHATPVNGDAEVTIRERR